MTKFFISRTKISNRCFACDQVAVKCTFENGEEEKRGGKKKKKKKEKRKIRRAFYTAVSRIYKRVRLL